ncbi:MAG: radical SAM protein [Tissierellia bacterium]|nr:radical SAM protein [Tissierellia bacterium]
MKSYSNIPIFISHQGCPHNCIYCNQKAITGRSGQVEREEVVRTIEDYLSTQDDKRNKEIAFFGGSFTALDLETQAFYLDLAKDYVGTRGIIGIRFSTRPDAISEEIMAFLSDYPISTIELGVQSLDDRVLLASGRGHGIVDVLRAVNLIRSTDVQLGLQMMTGLPGDDYDLAIFTAEKLISLKPDFVRIYPTLVIKGTGLEALAARGAYIPWNLEETLELLTDIMKLFLRAQIPVIRLGLYSSEADFLDSIVAGPYHPALRSLVMGRLYRRKLEELAGPLDLEINPKELSYLLGQSRVNKVYFEEQGRRINFSLNDQLPRNGFVFQGQFISIY